MGLCKSDTVCFSWSSKYYLTRTWFVHKVQASECWWLITVSWHQHVQPPFLLYLDAAIPVLVCSWHLLSCKLCNIWQPTLLTASLTNTCFCNKCHVSWHFLFGHKQTFQLNVKFTRSKLSLILLLIRSQYRPDCPKSKFDAAARLLSVGPINRMLQNF
jgi:hypothetical protein